MYRQLDFRGPGNDIREARGDVFFYLASTRRRDTNFPCDGNCEVFDRASLKFIGCG